MSKLEKHDFIPSCLPRNTLMIVLSGKSVTKSIADRVALLTYGVINMSMVSCKSPKF